MESFQNMTNNTVKSITDNSSILQQSAFFEKYYLNFIVFVAIGGGICLFGVISNIVCFIAILTYPPLKRRGNILVANLVIVNILLSLTVHPVTIVSTLTRQYRPLPLFFCDWLTYYHFVVNSFVWHECLLSINRFVAIVFPHQYKYISTKPAIVCTLILGYLIAFLNNSYPLSLDFHMYLGSTPFGSCLFSSAYNGPYPKIQSVLGTYLPLSIIGSCYGVLFCTAYLTNYFEKRRQNQTLVSKDNSVKVRPNSTRTRRLRLARMLFGCFVWNTVTYLPAPVLMYFVKDFNTRFPTSFFYNRWILQSGAGFSSVVYALLHRDFRNGILAVLRCSPRRTAPEHLGTATAISIANKNRPHQSATSNM